MTEALIIYLIIGLALAVYTAGGAEEEMKTLGRYQKLGRVLFVGIWALFWPGILIEGFFREEDDE